MRPLRTNRPTSIAGFEITGFDDLEQPSDGLPPTNGIRLWLAGKYRVIVRPSGTEPKIKCYIEVVEPTAEAALPIVATIESAFRTILQVA